MNPNPVARHRSLVLASRDAGLVHDHLDATVPAPTRLYSDQAIRQAEQEALALKTDISQSFGQSIGGFRERRKLPL